MASLAQSATGTAQPTATSKAGGKHRRYDIQGLRAVAVLMVVLFHAGLYVPGGFIGVDVFFVISGFVITAMLLREWTTLGKIRLFRFYVRRFKRLTPALALTVGVTMIASLLLLSPMGIQQTVSQTALGAMFLASNLVIARTTGDYFDSPAENNPLLSMWSLSVEEQFYIIFPAMMFIAWTLGRRTHHSVAAPVAVVGLMGAVSFVLAMSGSFGIDLPFLPETLVGFYSPISRAWEFAVGSLLALGGSRLVIPEKFAGPSMFAGAAILIASLWLITAETAWPSLWTLLPAIGSLLLIAAGSNDTVVTRALSSKWMVKIGDLSYSIYLWHWPFIVFAHLLWPDSAFAKPVAAVLSFIPAYVSYTWVEEPIRTSSITKGRPLVGLVAATVIPPVALAGGLGLSTKNGFWDPQVRAYQASINPHHAGMAAGCTDASWTKVDDCTWNGEATGAPVYLVGDSNADQFIEPLINAAETAGRPLVSLSQDGCSYLPNTWLESPSAEDCGSYSEITEDYLRSARPGLVVIANSYFKVSPEGIVQSSGIDPDVDSGLAELSSSLSAAVTSLQEAGHEVLLIQTIPHWRSMSYLNWHTCSPLRIKTDGCAQTMPLSYAAERQGPAAGVVEDVAASTGARLLDFSEVLCPGGSCSSVAEDGMIRYRDGTHITVVQAEALTPLFDEVVPTNK